MAGLRSHNGICSNFRLLLFQGFILLLSLLISACGGGSAGTGPPSTAIGGGGGGGGGTPGTPAKIAFIVQPTSTSVGAPITPAVQVAIQDSNGNVVGNSSATVILSLGTNPTGANLAGNLSVNAINGVATFSNLSLDKAGTGFVLSALAPSFNGTASSVAFNIAGVPAKLAFTVSPSNSAVTQPITPAVKVVIQDANGTTVGNASNSVTIAIGTNPGAGVLSGTKTVAAVSGVATFSDLSIDKAGVGYTLTASSPGLLGAVSVPFNEAAAAGGPAKLAFNVQPSNAIVNTAISPAMQVTVQDVNGTVVSTATNSVTLTLGANPGGATLAGVLTVAAVNGVAAFSNVSLNAAGTNYTLVAQAGGGITNATSAPFTVSLTPGPSAGLIELNNLRALANLPPVNETASLSTGAQAHANWMLLNNKVQHFEDVGSPGYSAAGNLSASKSNLAAWSGLPVPTIQQEIDHLMTAPFHGIGFIDPRLLNTGFGFASNASIPFPNIDAAAVVDIASSLAAGPPAGTTYPIMWPANGKTVPFTSYAGNEYPDPTTSAPGAQGLPIYLQLGSDPGQTNPPLSVTSFSLIQQGGGVIPTAQINWRNYTNPDGAAQALGRAVLDTRMCIVLMPTPALTKGATYNVSINANGTLYTWSFTVAANATPRRLEGGQGQIR